MKKKSLPFIITAKFFVYTLILLNCSNKVTKEKKKREINAYLLTHIMPSVMAMNGKGSSTDTVTAKVYFSGDKILYQASQKNYIYKGDKMITRNDFYYILHNKNEIFGYYYDRIHIGGMKVALDSFFKYRWYAQIKLYDIFLTSEHHLVNTSTNTKKEILQETYSLKGKGADSSKTGTITLLYNNKFSGENTFTLSRELDSIKRMKLVEVHIINNPRELKEYSMNLPRIETGYILNRIEKVTDKKVMEFFNTGL